MNLNSRTSLIARLRKGKHKRSQFVESHLIKGIAYQLRATRDELGWSQERLAKEVGMPQNAISRLESPDYGRPTLTTLRRLAEALDVGLIVHFVPFSQLVDWVSGTSRIDYGLSSSSLGVAGFEKEDSDGAFDKLPDLPAPLVLQNISPLWTPAKWVIYLQMATGVTFSNAPKFRDSTGAPLQFVSSDGNVTERKLVGVT